MRKLNFLTAVFFAAIILCAGLVAPAPSFAARSVTSTNININSSSDDLIAPPTSEETAAAPESTEEVEEEEATPRAISPRDAARPKSATVREVTPQAKATPSTDYTTPVQAVPAPVAAVSGSTHSDYVLGSGDKLKITVFGEADLSGPFEVSSTGMVSMPLIGQVRAAGNTVSRLESIITEKLRDGYMKDPRVSVEVQGYRPFFIVGEVMKPGRYDYVNGMTVITAVALAGGYTYRADKDGITLKHAGASAKESPVKEDAAVVPGDVIRVPERFF